MTNKIRYFIANWKMYGDLASLKSIKNVIKFSRLSKSKKFKNNGVLVKYPKKKQDLRIDLPTIGFQTLIQCKSAGLKGVVLKSKQNVFLERKKCINFANKNKMFITVR